MSVDKVFHLLQNFLFRITLLVIPHYCSHRCPDPSVLLLLRFLCLLLPHTLVGSFVVLLHDCCESPHILDSQHSPYFCWFWWPFLVFLVLLLFLNEYA